MCSGAWVEDKKISVTYHYKGVNDKLKAKLVETAKGLIQGHGFQLIETPYALEGKPRVNWDKGKSLCKTFYINHSSSSLGMFMMLGLARVSSG